MQHSEYRNIPGWELVSKGLQDIAAGRDATPEALMVRMISSRIIEFHIPFPYVERSSPLDVRLALYRSLGAVSADPYATFNAIQRRLASFCSIAQRVNRRATLG
jgi:hypothetical protein